jgi:hypothetical protein
VDNNVGLALCSFGVFSLADRTILVTTMNAMNKNLFLPVDLSQPAAKSKKDFSSHRSVVLLKCFFSVKIATFKFSSANHASQY